MQPGCAVIFGENTRVALQALHDKMHLGIGIVDLPWLILCLVLILAVASFCGGVTYA
jgi:hypothetical protein